MLFRSAYRTVLDTLFHALVRWAAPVLVFTAEEVWGTRFPGERSVHLLEWPAVASEWDDYELDRKWSSIRDIRLGVSSGIEPMRRNKEIGSSLEVELGLHLPYDHDGYTNFEQLTPSEWAEVFITSKVFELSRQVVSDDEVRGIHISVNRTTHNKCGRCWRHLPEVTEDGALCSRCDQVVAGMDAAAHV